MTPLAVVESFVKAINSGEVDQLVDQMTPDHMFVNADGSEHVGRDQMHSGWREYFDLAPDFRIKVHDRFVTENTVVLSGQASGTFIQNGELKPENHWSVPAAWRVVVDSDVVALWQLYADQHPMHEILERIRAA
jgi:uncharacterized protein (TIGR02246 family)